jgi:hypothetical protein
MQYDTSLATEAYELADRWDASRDTPVAELPFAAGDVAKLNSNQKSKFSSLNSTVCFPSSRSCSRLRGTPSRQTGSAIVPREEARRGLWLGHHW